MPAGDAVLELSSLNVSFAKGEAWLKVLEDIAFSIKPGESKALLGESGCGKSMMAHALMQLLPIDAYVHKESQLHLNGQNLFDYSEVMWRKIRGRKIAIIFQDPMASLNPVLTIGQQLQEVLIHQGLKDKKAISQKMIGLLDKVGIPNGKMRLDNYPHQFSGGQKQRIMIAMAIASEPELLIADEPTTALDVTVEAQILDLLKSLQQELNMAILLISHDLSVIKRLCQEVMVMYAGEIVEVANMDDFFSEAKHPYSQKLLKARPGLDKRDKRLDDIPGTVPSLEERDNGCHFRARCDFSDKTCLKSPALIKTETGFVKCHHFKNAKNNIDEKIAIFNQPTDKKNHEKIILKVTDVSVHYPLPKKWFSKEKPVFKAVDKVSFELRQGETLALVGESGCGKSTLSRALIRLQSIDSGVVDYQGVDFYQKHNKKAFAKTVQMIFQSPYSSMNPRMVVEDILLEGVHLHNLVEKNKRVAFAKKLLSDVGLSEASLKRYPHQFSGGQRQRLCLARALSMQPKILICDEPTSALDVSVQAQVLNLLKGLQQEYQLAYLFITHDMSVVSFLADRIMVMKDGKIIESGNALDLIKTPKKAYTQSLLQAVYA